MESSQEGSGYRDLCRPCMLQPLRPDRGGGPQQQPHLRVQQGLQQVRYRGHEEGAVQPASQRRHGKQDADIHIRRLVKSKYQKLKRLILIVFLYSASSPSSSLSSPPAAGQLHWLHHDRPRLLPGRPLLRRAAPHERHVQPGPHHPRERPRRPSRLFND